MPLQPSTVCPRPSVGTAKAISDIDDRTAFERSYLFSIQAFEIVRGGIADDGYEIGGVR
jgi:hypothetical protein